MRRALLLWMVALATGLPQGNNFQERGLYNSQPSSSSSSSSLSSSSSSSVRYAVSNSKPTFTYHTQATSWNKPSTIGVPVSPNIPSNIAAIMFRNPNIEPQPGAPNFINSYMAPIIPNTLSTVSGTVRSLPPIPENVFSDPTITLNLPKAVPVPVSTIPPLYPSQLPHIPAGPQTSQHAQKHPLYTTFSTGTGPITVDFVSQDAMPIGGKKRKPAIKNHYYEAIVPESHASSLNGGFSSHEFNSAELPNFNKTDVIIVKTEKKAYIIPTGTLTGTIQNPTSIQNLYAQRHMLDNPYTVNQFLFFIKPQNVNFLNKLV